MTTSVRSAVATMREKPTVAEFIPTLVGELEKAAPKGMDGERIARLALTLVRKDRALQECDPYSFAGALLTATALGLEVGTGEAHLVAYGSECTLIPDFKGYAKLFYQHPLAKHLDCQTVYERDDFDYALGTEPFLRHKPARGDRGAVEYYYAVASLSTGANPFVVLTPDEVKALRGGKVGPARSFKGGDPMRWMERKTALKQLLKLLPKSAQLQQALDADEKPGSELAYQRAVEGAPVPMAIEAPVSPAVDTATGEVLPVEDPPDPPAGWTDVEVRKPADA